MRLTKKFIDNVKDAVVAAQLEDDVAALSRAYDETCMGVYRCMVSAENEAAMRKLPVECVIYVKAFSYGGFDAVFKHAVPMPAVLHEKYSTADDLIEKYTVENANRQVRSQAICDILDEQVFSRCKTTKQLLELWADVVLFTDFYTEAERFCEDLAERVGNV